MICLKFLFKIYITSMSFQDYILLHNVYICSLYKERISKNMKLQLKVLFSYRQLPQWLKEYLWSLSLCFSFYYLKLLKDAFSSFIFVSFILAYACQFCIVINYCRLFNIEHHYVFAMFAWVHTYPLLPSLNYIA